MRAVICARYSSDNQREESIEGQVRECKEFSDSSKKLLEVFCLEGFESKMARSGCAISGGAVANDFCHLRQPHNFLFIQKAFFQAKRWLCQALGKGHFFRCVFRLFP